MHIIEYYKSDDHLVSIVCGRGVSKCFPTHRHLSLSIGMVLKGERTLIIGKREFVIAEGDVFIINTGEPHSIGLSLNPDHDYIVVSLSNKLLRQFFPSETFFETIIQSPALTNHLSVLFNSHIDKNKPDKLIDINLIISNLKLFIKPEKSRKDEDERLSRVKALLDGSSIDKHLVKKLANRAFLSEFHFARLFKKHTGMAPHQYLLDNRLRTARELLEKQNSIFDAAVASGFYDTSHFIRHFSKHFGVSPLEYQKGINRLPM